MAKRVPNPITYAGPPTHGTWDNNDVVVDVNGIVWICNSSGSPGSWTEGSTGGGSSGGVTSVSVVSANGFAGTVATATTTPAITIETSVSGLLKGNGTGVSGATAGTDYLTPSGSGASLTGITASQVGALPSTDDLSAIASANATAGNVAMNSHKITGLSNGTVSTDAAAFGQIPTALPPNGSASGDLSGSYPGPTVAKINGSPLGTMGTPSSNQGLLWNGTAWVPTTITQSMVTNAQQGPLTGDVTTSGAAATLVGTANVESIIRANRLDQMANPTTAVAGNGQQATGWADGTHATDLATVEQTTNWVQDSNTWTRASNTSFTIAGNVTGIFVAGTAVKWTESSTQKYGVVASSSYSSPNTTVTLCSTSDYVMAASPDSSSNNWAHGQPRDFPMQFTWSITTSGWSGTPTTAGSFGVIGKNLCMLEYYVSGTSNAGNADLTNPPFTPGGASARAYYSTIVAQDSGTVTPGTAQCSQGTATIKCCKGVNLAAISEGWTSSGTKTVMGNFIYPF